MTNEISGRQKVVPIGYEESLSELDTFAAEWRRRHRHQRVFSPRVVGFCMLSRASLYDAIGPLDETFGTGNYEDDDLCLRAELAGFRNVIAADVFIHHHGSRSFTGNAIDHQTTMTHNRARFAEKWQHPHATDARGRRVLLLEALLNWTWFGRAIRALVQNPYAGRIVGESIADFCDDAANDVPVPMGLVRELLAALGVTVVDLADEHEHVVLVESGLLGEGAERDRRGVTRAALHALLDEVDGLPHRHASSGR